MWVSAQDMYDAGLSTREINTAIKEDEIGFCVFPEGADYYTHLNDTSIRVTVRNGRIVDKEGCVHLWLPSLPHYWIALFWYSQAVHWRAIAEGRPYSGKRCRGVNEWRFRLGDPAKGRPKGGH